MKNFIVKFTKDESGATAIEYGLIAALIAIGIIASVSSIGNDISNMFSTTANGIAENEKPAFTG